MLDKRFNRGLFCYIGEATYRSIDFTALNAGAAPMLSEEAATLAEQAKRRWANGWVGRRLGETLGIIDLHETGLMREDVDYLPLAQNLRRGIIDLNRQAQWTPEEIREIDERVNAVNERLAPDFRLSTLTGIIQETQNKYLLEGNPMWP